MHKILAENAPKGTPGRKKADEMAASAQPFDRKHKPRSAAVLSARLAQEHPDFYAALMRGEYASVTAAATAAGLLKTDGGFACRWLELNDPNYEVGLSEAVKGGRQQAAIDAAKEEKEPLKERGANQHTDNADEDVTNSDNVTSSRGNDSSYRIRRLLRDKPEAVERLRGGEFKSVAAAERWHAAKNPRRPGLLVDSRLDVG